VKAPHLKLVFLYPFLLFIALFFTGCGAYQQNLLFRGGEYFDNGAFQEVLAEAEKNYKIEKFDYLAIQVFTNSGEAIIDPNGEFRGIQNSDVNPQRRTNNNMQPVPRWVDPMRQGNGGMGGMNQMGGNIRTFLVGQDGTVDLPKIGKVDLSEKTLAEATELLRGKYSKFYEKPFVQISYTSKRVVVMGALGAEVVPLLYENMNLLEAIARVGNPDQNARANQVRLIRGVGTENMRMQQIDLTTWEGLQKAELILQPNDVIYIEPRRRVGRELISDIGTVLQIVGSTMTLVLTTLLLYDRASGN
jgi:polysaccharide export outer membrane protein